MIRALAFATVVLAAAAASASADIPANLAVDGDAGIQLAGATLFKGPVSGAVFDPQQDLIWFVTKGTLEVIDLRDAAHAPVVIAKKIPTEGFSISGFSSAAYDTDYTGVYTHFDFGAKATVVGEDGAYAGVDEVSDNALKKKAKKVSIVGKKWLAAQKDRKANPKPAERAAPAKATLPAGLGQCDDDDECGAATWLGASLYQIVIVDQSCGDACYVKCALYDPARKTFAPVLADGAWGPLTDKTDLGACWGFEVEPGNARYAAGGRVCTLGAKLTCTDLGAGWTAFGWVATKPQ